MAKDITPMTRCRRPLRMLLVPALALVATLWTVPAAHGQSIPFSQALPGTSAGSRFGVSVDVDGDVAVVGTDQSGNSPAHVFIRLAGVWTRQLLRPSDATSTGFAFGRAVAVSGTTLAIGAPFAAQGGAVYVFVWNGSSWTEQAKLTAPGGLGVGSSFGRAVALEGNTLVVGAQYANIGPATGAGKAYVFERIGASWSGQELDPQTTLALQDYFGSDVEVSGNTLCVGAPESSGTSKKGSVYVFTRGATAWALQQRVVPAAALGGDQFGVSCTVNGDTLVAGTNFSSYAYIFGRSGATWSQQARLRAGDLNAGNGGLGFGNAVAVNGPSVFVSASTATSVGGDVATGRVYNFTRTGTTWPSEPASTVQYSLANSANYRFGTAVAFDGVSLIMGAPCDAIATCSGLAHVYSSAAPPPGPPGAPTSFQASANGNTVSLSWGAPASGGAPTSYSVVVRPPPNIAAPVVVPVGNVTTLVAPGVPNGVYALTVLATNAAGPGAESSSVTVTVPNVPVPPGPPTNLTVAVAGSTASFAWGAPASGGPVASYRLIAGATSGFTLPLGSLPLPASPASVAIPGIPPGTFYVRLVAENGGGASAASNEVAFTVAGPSAPAMPTLNAPTVAGTTVTLSWAPGSGGAAPTSYVLNVTGAVVASAPLTGTSITVPGVPSGTYFLRLTAVNGVGPSPPSAQVTLVVP